MKDLDKLEQFFVDWKNKADVTDIRIQKMENTLFFDYKPVIGKPYSNKGVCMISLKI